MATKARIVGLDELHERLSRLSGVVPDRAIRSGFGGAGTAIKKVIRANVNAQPVNTDHEASLKAGVRKSVGSSVKKAKSGQVQHGYVLKVGFGVGAKGAKRDRRLSSGETIGQGKRIGVSARNIHWFVLGTRGTRRPGQLAPMFKDGLRESVQAATPTAVRILRERFNAAIKREVARGATKVLIQI